MSTQRTPGRRRAFSTSTRTSLALGHYDARRALSPATLPLYTAVHEVLGRGHDDKKSLVWNDDEQTLDTYIDAITDDLRGEGRILSTVEDARKALL